MPTVVSSTLSAAQATSLTSASLGVDVQVVEFEIVHGAMQQRQSAPSPFGRGRGVRGWRA